MGTKPKFQSYGQEFAKRSFQARSIQLYALVWILPLYRVSWVPLRNYKDTRASSKVSLYKREAWFLSGSSHFRISSLSMKFWKIHRKPVPCDLHHKLLLSNNIWIFLCWVHFYYQARGKKYFSDIHMRYSLSAYGHSTSWKKKRPYSANQTHVFLVYFLSLSNDLMFFW